MKACSLGSAAPVGASDSQHALVGACRDDPLCCHAEEGRSERICLHDAQLLDVAECRWLTQRPVLAEPDDSLPPVLTRRTPDLVGLAERTSPICCRSVVERANRFEGGTILVGDLDRSSSSARRAVFSRHACLLQPGRTSTIHLPSNHRPLLYSSRAHRPDLTVSCPKFCLKGPMLG